MSKFVHLHNHTDNSILDGAAKISDYMKMAKEMNMDTLAITDHGNMFGAITFAKECKANGIKPIIGCEFYIWPESHTTTEVKNRYHMILLCQNKKGYENMIKLNSISYTEGFYYKPRISDKLLEEYNEGIICLSACIAGEIPQLLLKSAFAIKKEEKEQYYNLAKKRALYYKNLFNNGRYFLEIQKHFISDEDVVRPLLIKLSKETNIPLVATNDVHYLKKEHSDAHDTLIRIGRAIKKSDIIEQSSTDTRNYEGNLIYKTSEFYLKSEDQMIELFKDIPEAIENTRKIADMCSYDHKSIGPILPLFEIPKEFKNEADYLRYVANQGLKKRYSTVTKELQERLDYELDTIIDLEFPGYFLIVWDFIRWARENKISVGPGRGSGAGSLVAYAMTITDVDPIKYGLLFERFLNKERVSMPDFDIDFCKRRRGEVIDYVTNHYGKEKVAQIVAYGTLKAKAILKDVARVLDIPLNESNHLTTKLVPDELPNDKDGKKNKINIPNLIRLVPEIKEIYERGGVYKQWFDTSSILENNIRQLGTHAAGIVIGREAIDKYVPVYIDTKTKAMSTQYDKQLIEDEGLVKMDFLGLSTLTLIDDAIELIHKHTPSFDIRKIDEQDPKTFEMLCNGESDGVFQFESPGMQKNLKSAKPGNIEDLVALNALYRPGPMQYIPQFINSKLGKQKIQYPHPELEELLKPTYGVIVYQEQVMKVAQIISGYTLGQADILRRIMGKKKVEALAAEEKKFIEGAVKLGRTKEMAKDLFEMLKPFAGYGFNKSHAVAYSIVAYQTAYLKANYPCEFMAANLTNEMNNPDKYREYLGICKKLNISVQAPDINYSGSSFSVKNGNIVYGLAGIKGVGPAVIEEILEARKDGEFTDFMDFLTRVPSKAKNTGTLTSLINSGAFDCFNHTRSTLIANTEKALAYLTSKEKAKGHKNQASLFGDEEELFEKFTMDEKEEYELKEKLDREKDLIGFYVSGHPLDKYRTKIEQCILTRLNDPRTYSLDNPRKMICLVENIKKINYVRNNRQKSMAVITLSDYTTSIDALVFGKTWENLMPKIESNKIYAFTGVFRKKEGQETINYMIDDILDIDTLSKDAIRETHFVLNKGLLSQTNINILYNKLLENSGGMSTILHLKDYKENEDGELTVDEKIIQISSDYSTNCSDNLINDFKDFEPLEDIYFN